MTNELKKPAQDVIELATLVKRGLNLCAQARNIDKAAEKARGSMTPILWATEHYEKDLQEWERDASSALAALSAMPAQPSTVSVENLANIIHKAERYGTIHDSELAAKAIAATYPNGVRIV